MVDGHDTPHIETGCREITSGYLNDGLGMACVLRRQAHALLVSEGPCHPSASRTLTGAVVKKAGGKVSEAGYQYALDRVAAGHTMTSVCRELGLSDTALSKRASKDAVFALQLLEARQIAADAVVDKMLLVAAGVPGYSTGCIDRDRLLTSALRWYAIKSDPAAFSDRSDVKDRSVEIVIDDNSIKWN